jgi:hypothetical protein
MRPSVALIRFVRSRGVAITREGIARVAGEVDEIGIAAKREGSAALEALLRLLAL